MNSHMLKKRITWLALGLIAAIGVGAFAAPPLNLIPVYLWLSGQAVSASNPVPVSDAGGSFTVDGNLSVVGNTANVEASFTRPADTTAYAAGDVISNSTSSPSVITFANVAAAGLGGMITDVVVSDSAAQSTKLEAELWLFHTAPAATNDNSAFAISDAEADDVLCIVPLGSGYGSVGGGNFVYHVRNLGCAFEAAGSGTDIYGVLVARNAYTPVSAEVFNFRLHVLKD